MALFYVFLMLVFTHSNMCYALQWPIETKSFPTLQEGRWAIDTNKEIKVSCIRWYKCYKDNETRGGIGSDGGEGVCDFKQVVQEAPMGQMPSHQRPRGDEGPSLEATQWGEAAGKMAWARSVHGVFREQQGGQPDGAEWARARVGGEFRETKGRQEEQAELIGHCKDLLLGVRWKHSAVIWSSLCLKSITCQLSEGTCTFHYRGKDERQGCVPPFSPTISDHHPFQPQTHFSSLLRTFFLISMNRTVDLKWL